MSSSSLSCFEIAETGLCLQEPDPPLYLRRTEITGMYYRGEFYVVLGLGLHIQLPVIDFGIQVVGKLRQAVVCVCVGVCQCLELLTGGFK